MLSPRQIRRALVIVWTFISHGLLVALWRDAHGRHAGTVCTCAPSTRSEARARRLRASLESLGPTFVKLGQLLSRRSDILPPSYAPELEKLQDKTAPVPFEAIARELASRCVCKSPEGPGHEHDAHCVHCLGVLGVFESFDEEAVASASLAQVHRARFQGTDVAVKVLKPGVRESITLDLATLWGLRRVLGKALGLGRAVDVDGFLVGFRNSLLHELDFAAEGLEIEAFRATHATGPVRAPAVVWGFERDDVLVMEFVQGHPLRDAATIPVEERKRVARVIFDDFVEQVFLDNMFHADPHPGNLLLEPDGRICYLDFGSVGRLDTVTWRRALGLMFAVAHNDVESATLAILRIGGIDESRVVDARALREDVALVLLASHVPSSGRFSDRLLKVVRTHGIPLPPSALLMVRSLVLIESLTFELDPAFDVQAAIQKAAPGLLARGIWREAEALLRAIVEGEHGLVATILEAGRPSPS